MLFIESVAALGLSFVWGFFLIRTILLLFFKSLNRPQPQPMVENWAEEQGLNLGVLNEA